MVTNQQLYLLIGIPMLFNATVLGLVLAFINARFNAVDRNVDQLLIATAGEPFVEPTLRPLHTIFRRIGWLYHTKVARGQNLQQSVDCHIALLEAVADRHIEKAIAALDDLIGFVDSMFDVLEQDIDPSLLDCSLAYLRPH